MQVSRQQKEWLEEALAAWQQDGLLDAHTGSKLLATMEPAASSRQQLGRLFVLIACACALLALAAIFIDDKILERLRVYYDLSLWVVAIAGTAIGTVWYAWQLRHQRRSGATVTTRFYPGTILLLTGLLYAAKGTYPAHEYNLFFGAGALLCAALGLRFRSLANWLTGLLLFGAWFATFSETHGAGNAFLGMNYPVRFAMIGAVSTGITLLFKNAKRFAPFYKISVHASLLVLLSGMWGVSVFGNYTSLEEWQLVRQSTVLAFGFLAATISIACIWRGIATADDVVRDFGVVFLLLNLYTRYFEFFWDAMNKGIFFLLLALLFYVTGRLLYRRSRKMNQEKALKQS